MTKSQLRRGVVVARYGGDPAILGVVRDWTIMRTQSVLVYVQWPGSSAWEPLKTLRKVAGAQLVK
jgi:hypothetical protein